MNFTTKTYSEVSDELLDVLSSLEKRIFDEPYSREKIQREASARHQLLAIVAFIGDDACAFKVGYEMTARLFFSWIGGVVPEQRGKGIARELMQEQHSIAKSMGYKAIRTHTENKFRKMLLLNIRFGFDVVGVCTSDHSSKTTIMLEKLLA